MKNTIIAFCLFSCTKLLGQESALLDINDVSAGIQSDGSLFNFNKFEVPKGSKKSSIFSGGIWIGGYDSDNNLHLAAQQYPNSTLVDIYYGPIAFDYGDSSYILRYNNVWKINKSTILDHVANYKMTGYKVPASIHNWPGNGNVSNGEAVDLAPYVDVNSNTIYDPANGDYPDIRGDQAIFFITNDAKQLHTNSHAEIMGIEIHGMAYSFASIADSALNQTVFVNFQIINRRAIDYFNVYVGIFLDMEIGEYFNDFVGSDSLLNMSYGYNGTTNDRIYGNNSPAQGCVILNHPLSTFMYYANVLGNPPPATTDPGTAIEYYNYLQGVWRNGTPLTRGGTGYNPGSIDTSSFAFGGDPLGTGWTEFELGNIARDRRGITTVGPVNLNSGASICLDVAFPYARDYVGNNLTSIKVLKDRVRSIHSFYQGQNYNCPLLSTKVNQSNQHDNLISIYPNPNNGIFQIDLNQIIHNNNYKVEIFNAIGTSIKYSNPNSTVGTAIKQFNNFDIDISSQPAGIYFVRISDGKKLYSAKIVIQ